jgi:hypothetical protein
MPHVRLGFTWQRAALLAVVVFPAGLMVALGWSNVDRLATGWRIALVSSTALVGLAVVLVLTGRRLRLGGAALLLAAVTCPTGFGFLVNAAVAVLAVGLMVTPWDPVTQIRAELQGDREAIG